MSFHADTLLCDPLTDPASTPASKRRKLDSVVVTPPPYSDLLAAFGARQVPSSVSKMSKQSERMRQLRGETKTQGFSYAESDDSDLASPNASPGSSSGGHQANAGAARTTVDLTSSDSDDGDDESGSEDDVIEG